MISIIFPRIRTPHRNRWFGARSLRWSRVVLGVVTGPSDGSIRPAATATDCGAYTKSSCGHGYPGGVRTARALAQQYCTALGAALLAVSAAARLPEAVGGGRRVGVDHPRRGAVPDEPLTARQRVVWAALPPGGMSVADACRALGCTRALLNALVKKGVADLEQRSELHEATVDGGRRGVAAASHRAPTAEQSRALTWLQTALKDGVAAHARSCGGSRAAARPRSIWACCAETIRRGRGAIVLVPEIALTGRFAAVFRAGAGTGVVSVVHSGLALRPEPERSSG